MASRAQTTVGSAAWIAAEKENAYQLLAQEKEEIIFPAQHEMEWLNEHMAEIFSKSQFNVTDVFKTPGKLRGKTPRTARKRNVQEARIPLGDVFSSNPQAVASPRQNKFNKQLATFEIAKDLQPKAASVPKPTTTVKPNTDSGYHGMTEDEMEVDLQSQQTTQNEHGTVDQDIVDERTPLGTASVSPPDERRTTEGSFHSAKEEQTAKLAALMQSEPVQESPAKSPEGEAEFEAAPRPASPTEDMEVDVPEKQAPFDIEHEFSDIGSPSDGSTPDRPIVRKSSLTFASLPAREPLTKKSIGNRTSRTSQIEQFGSNAYGGRLTGGNRSTQIHPEPSEPIRDHDMLDGDQHRPVSLDDSDAETRATKLHNKSSTQRLHEKIDMLGKTQPPRQSKSIPNLAALTAKSAKTNQVPAETTHIIAPKTTSAHSIPDDDDSWIKPLESTPPRPGLTKSHTMDMMEQIPERDTVGDLDYHIPAPEQWYERSPDDAPVHPSPPKLGHQKSASTVTLVSPGKAAMAPMGHSKNISVSNPSNPTYDSTTPMGSPKRTYDGPLSASKSRLQSIMKTAKSLFSSSAGISAAAKMEVLSPTAVRAAANNMPGLYPNVSAMLEDKPLPPSPVREPRKTRSSTEREREEQRRDRERQKVDDQLEKAREKERQKAAGFKAAQDKAALAKPNRPPTRTSPRRAQDDQMAVTAQQTASNQQQAPGLKQNEAKRPVRPTKEALQKSKPPTVAIRVGTMSQRVLPSANGTTGPSEGGAAQTAPKPTLTKKASSASINTTTSTNSFKSSMTSQGKPKALILAAQKREQEERETQRKAEEKREAQRKRAAQQEEARRQEQKQRQEADRLARERAAAEEAKRLAQKQAVEKRRLEAARKAEQQRSHTAASEIASNRNEPGPNRPPSRLAGVQPMPRSMVNHPLPNPAKPPKRHLEEEPASNRPQASTYGGTSQQADPKRRRTGDQGTVEQPPMRPTMAPPVRQSNIKSKTSMLPYGYAHAPAPAPIRDTAPQSYGNSQSSSTYNPQPYHGQLNRPAYPMDARYTNQRIVFADAPNPPSHHQQQHQSQFKTPNASHHHAAQQQRSIQMVKSSPAFPNGDNISLPDIPTDSEDSDSDASPSFPVPSWASPSALQRMLIEQEANGTDPDAVFGPMAPLRMEEIFAKGTHKDRLKRLRDRTSSARWIENGDVLTKEEVEKDKIARDRIRGEGGWRMGIS